MKARRWTATTTAPPSLVAIDSSGSYLDDAEVSFLKLWMFFKLEDVTNEQAKTELLRIDQGMDELEALIQQANADGGSGTDSEQF